MDTGIGDRENTGWHLQPATKVCTRRSDGRTTRPAPKSNQPESARVSQRDSDLLTVLLSHTTSMPAGHVGTKSEEEMWHA